MKIDVDELSELLALLDDRDITEFEYEDKVLKLRVVRGARPAPVLTSVAPAVTAVSPAGQATPVAVPKEEGVVVTSPFVGTFYRASKPDAEPFVSVGGRVTPGKTLCIVEAMKLMNEIDAEIAGTVLEVLVENGKSVEFGQRLFRIKPD